MDGGTTALLGKCFTIAANVAGRFPHYGLAVDGVRTLPPDLTALATSDLRDTAYRALGAALRHGGGGAFNDAERGEVRQAIVSLHASLTVNDQSTIPALFRNPAYFLGETHRVDDFPLDDTMLGLLRDPSWTPCWKAISRIWRDYKQSGEPQVRALLEELSRWLGVTPLRGREELLEVHRRLALVKQIIGNYGARISERLQAELERREGTLFPEQREALDRLWKFLGHDMAKMLPYQAIDQISIYWKLKSSGTIPPVARLVWDSLRMWLRTEYRSEAVGVLSFPLEILPRLFALATERPTRLDEVDLHALAAICTGLLLPRTLRTYLLGRTLYQRAGIQPELVITDGEDLPPSGQEGFFLQGRPGDTIRTHACLARALAYNTHKNNLRAQGAHVEGEDPYPWMASLEICREWEGRQADHVWGHPLRYEVETTNHWRGERLPPVVWQRIRDTAGGFQFNALLEGAMAMTEQALYEITGLSGEWLIPGLASLDIGERDPLVGLLQRRLGLTDRSLVGRLFDAVLNQRKLGRFYVEELMQLAAIHGLSAHDTDDGKLRHKSASGWGLFATQILSAAAGVVYAPSPIARRPAGTETVLAFQSLAGLRHSEATIRGVLERTVG